jgi:preprotein translocase subunit YajC
MLISDAYAQTTTAASSGGLMQMLPLVLMFVVLWFFMIRPQMRRAKEHKTMLDALKVGDEIVTQGGITGHIAQIHEQYVKLKLCDSQHIVIQKPAIATLLPAGTLSTLKLD